MPSETIVRTIRVPGLSALSWENKPFAKNFLRRNGRQLLIVLSAYADWLSTVWARQPDQDRAFNYSSIRSKRHEFMMNSSWWVHYNKKFEKTHKASCKLIWFFCFTSCVISIYKPGCIRVSIRIQKHYMYKRHHAHVYPVDKPNFKRIFIDQLRWTLKIIWINSRA